jgi:hypothetical protein
MLFHGQMVRVIAIVGATAVAGALVAPETSASAARSRSAASGHAFALGGSTAGGITTIQSSQTLTFVFTETNQSKAAANEDLELINVAHVTVSDAGMTCVLSGGLAINPDGHFCEPGFVKSEHHASMVLTTIAGASGAIATARVCLSNESTGVRGPCKSVSVNIG